MTKDTDNPVNHTKLTTNVARTGKHLCRQQCVRNNVSSFARALTLENDKSQLVLVLLLHVCQNPCQMRITFNTRMKTATYSTYHAIKCTKSQHFIFRRKDTMTCLSYAGNIFCPLRKIIIMPANILVRFHMHAH